MKKSLYPKTRRFADNSAIITEKLDGSNLGIFKLGGELIIAQRNNVFKESELTSDNSYKGLIHWLSENGDILRSELIEESGVFGEWISMGRISYADSDINKRFYIFAKANIDSELEVRNIIYNSDLFKYPFVSQEVPEFIGVVPELGRFENISKDTLDKLYSAYCETVDRNVEGFVVNRGNQITKYVRMKDGKFGEHKK